MTLKHPVLSRVVVGGGGGGSSVCVAMPPKHPVLSVKWGSVCVCVGGGGGGICNFCCYASKTPCFCVYVCVGGGGGGDLQ